MTSTLKLFKLIIPVCALMILACKENSSSKEGILKKDTVSGQSSKSAVDFNDPAAHKVLTSDIIDQTSDQNLLQAVFDNLNQKLPTDDSKEYETVLSWNKSRQAIYITWWLEAEVNNGGFNQYYVNSSGAYADLAPEALKLIEAKEIAELATRANKIYKKEYEKISKYQDGTVEGFSKSYENNPLNKLDDEFYELSKLHGLGPLQVKYIRSHKDQFIDN